MYNNIVQMNSSRPVLNIRSEGLTGTLTLSNNEYYNSGSGAIADDVHGYYGGLSGWQSRGFDANSFWASAQLDATNNNYKLTGSSPAIDKGKAAPINYDYGMNARPYGAAFDIGAWEYGSSTDGDAAAYPDARSDTHAGSDADLYAEVDEHRVCRADRAVHGGPQCHAEDGRDGHGHGTVQRLDYGVHQPGSDRALQRPGLH